MAIQTLGQTPYFVVKYEDTLGQAQRRAQALLAGVDDDLQTLFDWFQLGHDGFGTANRITVQVQTDSLATNYAYKSDGTTLITLDSLEGAGATVTGDDGAMALFVAEMSEVLMSYRQLKKDGKWNAKDSMGEGLSRFCTALMHPLGYYGVKSMGTPSINTWFTASDRNQSSRDWITKVNPTDKDDYSYGASIVFLYYLYSQLNYGIRDIILSGGANLAVTYQNLTGKADAYLPFIQLLDKYYPTDKITSLPTDDPFPLLTATDRHIELSFTQVLNGTRLRVAEGAVTLSPYIGCPAQSYRYWIDNTPQLDHCVATVTGFGEPKYSWKVNGQAIDVSAGSGRVITTTTTVLLDNPADPKNPSSTTQSVQILCRPVQSTSTWQGMQGGLDLLPYSAPGHIMVNIEVDVTEKYASDTGVTAGSKTTIIDQRTLTYEPQYYVDRDRCFHAFWDRVRDISDRYAKSRHIFIWQTLPDPGPEIVTALRYIEELRSALYDVEQENPRDGRLLRTMLATMLNVSPSVLGEPRRMTEGSIDQRRVESVMDETMR
jgi:hypothetical protein